MLHLLPPPPPTHPHCRSLIRPHHQLHKTNTYESQQERIHKSGCSSIQIVLLLLFQEPLWRFFLSLLRVCCLNHNCFVMESELDLWAETGDSFYLIAVNLLLLFKSSFFELDMQSRSKSLPHNGKKLESPDDLMIDTFLWYNIPVHKETPVVLPQEVLLSSDSLVSAERQLHPTVWWRGCWAARPSVQFIFILARLWPWALDGDQRSWA